MIKKNIKGVYIQVSEYPREQGSKSKGFVVEEGLGIAYSRIRDLYEQLSNKEEVIIKHIK